MLDFPRWKIWTIVSLCLVAVYFALPTLVSQNSTAYEAVNKALPDNKVQLGLDLQGGVHLVLKVDFDGYFDSQLDNLKKEVRNVLRDREQGLIGYKGGLPIRQKKLVVRLREAEQQQQAYARIRAGRRDLLVEKQGDNGITVQYTEAAIEEMRQYVINQSIEIVRKRVDETGTKEPSIQRQGFDRIILQMPGITDSSAIKKLLEKTAKLSFHLLDKDTPIAEIGKSQPSGTFYMPADENTHSSSELGLGYNVMREAMISGESLINASSTFQEGEPVVSFRFDSSAAKKFGSITKQNVMRRFAVVLDGKVITAPVIREPILSGSGIISGSFTSKTAADLAVLLRSGALPADLSIIEERTVGPSLGADSIEEGKNAFIIGVILVMLFMLIVYGRFGIYSNLALLINAAIIITVLSLIGATLTLPGIAGIVLTMGMAVDANVLIFERIREESRSGKNAFLAAESGFRHAFKTIIDSNITTLIAALLLFNFGSGAIKGFAVTLSIGIIASMFSAILFTRMMVVLWIRRTRPKVITI